MLYLTTYVLLVNWTLLPVSMAVLVDRFVVASAAAAAEARAPIHPRAHTQDGRTSARGVHVSAGGARTATGNGPLLVGLARLEDEEGDLEGAEEGVGLDGVVVPHPNEDSLVRRVDAELERLVELRVEVVVDHLGLERRLTAHDLDIGVEGVPKVGGRLLFACAAGCVSVEGS